MKNKKIKITIKKDAKKGLYLQIKAPIEIEKFFTDLSSNELGTSQKWVNDKKQGIEFYKLTADCIAKMDELQARTNYRQSIFNDFGDGLIKFENGRTAYNIAPFRAKNVSKGIKIFHVSKELISNADIEFYIRETADFLKILWKEYISKKAVKALITLEV